jgi:hypothetical protein
MPPDTVNDQIKLWWVFLLCKLSELDLELFSSLLKKEILFSCVILESTLNIKVNMCVTKINTTQLEKL